MKRLLSKLDRKRTASNLFVLLAAVAFYMLLANLSDVLTALGNLYSYFAILVGGIALAYVLNPLVIFFEDHAFGKLKNRVAAHSLSVTLTVIAALAIIALLMWAIIPGIVSNATTLISDMDSYMLGLRKWLMALQEKIPYLNFNIDDLVGLWERALSMLTNWIKDNLNNILNASYKFGAGLFDAIVAFVLSIYILLDKEHLIRGLKRLCRAIFKKSVYESAVVFGKNSNQILKAYLGGNILDSFIIGMATFIFLATAGMPSPGLIAVIVGVTNFIPTFGPFIGAIPCTLLILLIDPGMALWFVVFTLIIQQIDGNLLKPLLFGDAAGIAPIWVLVSILVFGRMFGLTGMLLGVPIFAILKMIYDELIELRMVSRGEEDIYRSQRRLDKKSLNIQGHFGRIFKRGVTNDAEADNAEAE